MIDSLERYAVWFLAQVVTGARLRHWFETLDPHELTLEKFQAGSDGFIEVPDRPGLGLTLNEDFVKRYLVSESR